MNYEKNPWQSLNRVQKLNGQSISYLFFSSLNLFLIASLLVAQVINSYFLFMHKSL